MQLWVKSKHIPAKVDDNKFLRYQIHEHVVWFYIAVHHTLRVRMLQCFEQQVHIVPEMSHSMVQCS